MDQERKNIKDNIDEVKAKAYSVTDEDVKEDIKKDTREAKDWENELKYKIYAYLIDYTHRLEINPSIIDLAEHFDINTRKLRQEVNELHKEGLIENGKNPNSIIVKGYYVERIGDHRCQFCGTTLEYDKQVITKSDYIKDKFVCPHCKATAEFKIKGVRE